MKLESQMGVISVIPVNQILASNDFFSAHF